MTPTRCHLCASQNVVATVGGPTCTHHESAGVLWFPSWWDSATVEQRTVWLAARQLKGAAA
jgi:hypothetical protein